MRKKPSDWSKKSKRNRRESKDESSGSREYSLYALNTLTEKESFRDGIKCKKKARSQDKRQKSAIRHQTGASSMNVPSQVMWRGEVPWTWRELHLQDDRRNSKTKRFKSSPLDRESTPLKMHQCHRKDSTHHLHWLISNWHPLSEWDTWGTWVRWTLRLKKIKTNTSKESTMILYHILRR